MVGSYCAFHRVTHAAHKQCKCSFTNQKSWHKCFSTSSSGSPYVSIFLSKTIPSSLKVGNKSACTNVPAGGREVGHTPEEVFFTLRFLLAQNFYRRLFCPIVHVVCINPTHVKYGSTELFLVDAAQVGCSSE